MASPRPTSACLLPARFSIGHENEGTQMAEPLASTSGTVSPASAPPAPSPAAAYMAGNPAVFGLLIFSVGGTVLGISLLGYVSAVAQGGSVMPIILTGTGMGVLLTAIWAAAQGQTFLATVF